ncbi:MAG: ATP-grasp fold amidoligase family protein [Nonlabens sp.]
MGWQSIKRSISRPDLWWYRNMGTQDLKKRVQTYYDYYYQGRKTLDLNDPKDFNQKIQWLKVYFHVNILHELADKYAVRDFVKRRAGEKYLNELISVHSHAEDIDFNKLPDQFVIKGAHGCHYNLIVPDKSKLNINKARKLLNKWLARDYFKISGGEWAYKDVPRRLVIEKFMKQEGREILNDYKFFCFNGKPKFIQVDLERNVANYRCYYDINWEKQPFYTERNQRYINDVERPVCLEEMVGVARKLSKGFPFVRVDLYDVNDRVVFGEMTFYPADGRKEFVPEAYNKIIGDMLELPEIPDGEEKITSYP